MQFYKELHYHCMALHPFAQHRADYDARQERLEAEERGRIAKSQQEMTDLVACTLKLTDCHQKLARVKREQDLYKKHDILKELFNEIRSCARCKSIPPIMRDTIKNLMAEYDETNEEFNKAVDEHNARLDAEDAKLKKSHDNFVSMMQGPTSPEYDPFSGKPPPKAGSRRRNKKSKNSKKKSKKSRKPKSRRH